MTAAETNENFLLRRVFLLLATIFVLISLATYDPLDLNFYTSSPNSPAANRAGSLGAFISGYLLLLPFGLASWTVPFFTALWAASPEFPWGRPQTLKKTGGGLLAIFSASGLFALSSIDTAQGHFFPGGIAGLRLLEMIMPWFGHWGSVIILAGALTAGLFQGAGVAAVYAAQAAGSGIKLAALKLYEAARGLRKPPETAQRPAFKISKPEPREVVSRPEPESAPRKSIIRKKEHAPAPVRVPAEVKQRKITGDFKLPPLELLSLPKSNSGTESDEEIINRSKDLQDALHSYGVDCSVQDVNIGPIVSSFEVAPARGVKLSQITNLADDIALVMKTQSVRISPIPGKSVVGIEVPNKKPRFVHLREILQSEEFASSPPPLSLGLGTDILGKPLVADLSEMPHLLVAGTTGSGKTICLNTIILSILFNASPDEIKFMMVDPKRVELNVFEDLPHLVAPVVTNSKKAARALKWVVEEMDKRYFMLSKAGVRNISSYNKLVNGQDEKMWHMVVVIDELHDLMMVAQSAVEETITRLAQLSRAVGIHLVIATQRPSVDVITGVIKANLPCRISFQVSSKTDSRTILDANGAERLIGKGDMLFLPPGKGTLIRAQCSLVSDEETRSVANFLKDQRKPDYSVDIPEDNGQRDYDGYRQGSDMADDDELYEDALGIVLSAGKGSTSLLQRRLNIGYSRAARLLDMMEERGIISPSRGTKPRTLLQGNEENEEG